MPGGMRCWNGVSLLSSSSEEIGKVKLESSRICFRRRCQASARHQEQDLTGLHADDLNSSATFLPVPLSFMPQSSLKQKIKVSHKLPGLYSTWAFAAHCPMQSVILNLGCLRNPSIS